MTTQAATTDANALEAGDSFWLSLAADGDVLVVMEGTGMSEDQAVDVVLEGGRLKVAQNGATKVDAPSNEDHVTFLQAAPRLKVLEIYFGPSEDENRFVVHEKVTLADRTGNGNVAAG